MKVAAIWARVSTEGQRELSLEGQVKRVKEKLEGLGYVVPPDRILAVDWTSLNLYACPQFQELRQWIRAGEIQALGVLDRDRLAAQGLQRLTFLAECKDAGVELIPYQGAPMLEGPEGQLVELALAIGKQRSVERAGQGAKDGLRDRAIVKGLPPAPVNPYGYAWDTTRTQLMPTKDWPTAQFICREALAGSTLYRIQKALYAQGIPSPTGRPVWPIATIDKLMGNPIYGGRYYALRQEKIEPMKRQATTYGKTSHHYIPLEKAHYLPGIVVERPPLAWEEFLAVQKRQDANKLFAARNAKQTYRLRGIIYCDKHHRRYHGEVRRGYHLYRCSSAYQPGEERCPEPYLPGPALEQAIFDWAKAIIASPEVVDAELAHHGGVVEESAQNLRQHLATLESRQRKNLATETALVGIYSRGECSREAYERQAKLLQAERIWLAEEVARTQAQLETLEHRAQVHLSLGAIRQRLDGVTRDEPRLLLEALEIEVHVRESGELMIEANLPLDMTIVSTTPRDGCGPG